MNMSTDAMSIMFIIYLMTSAIWLSLFIVKKYFHLNKVGAWLGAILAALLWPFGLIFLFFKGQ